MMKANLIRTEGYRYRKRYIYACTKCGAEYSRCQYNDRISDLCGACKSKLDKEKAKKQLEKRKAKHDAEVRNKAIKEMYLELANKYTNLWNDASDSAKNRPKNRTNEAQCGYECIEATWTMAISILNDVFEQLKGGE